MSYNFNPHARPEGLPSTLEAQERLRRMAAEVVAQAMEPLRAVMTPMVQRQQEQVQRLLSKPMTELLSRHGRLGQTFTAPTFSVGVSQGVTRHFQAQQKMAAEALNPAQQAAALAAVALTNRLTPDVLGPLRRQHEEIAKRFAAPMRETLAHLTKAQEYRPPMPPIAVDRPEWRTARHVESLADLADEQHELLAQVRDQLVP